LRQRESASRQQKRALRADILRLRRRKANSQALYIISSGGNDVTYARDNISGGTPQQTLTLQQAYLSYQASVLAAAVANLQTNGAQHIIVNGLPGSGGLAAFYTSSLFADLTAAGVNYIAADVNSFVQQVEANPKKYGFTPQTVMPGIVGTGTGSACVWTPPSGSTLVSGWGQWCADTLTPPSGNANTFYAYLRSADAEQTSFWSDDQHFSAAGQMLEAEFDLSLLGVPGPIVGTGLPGLILAGGVLLLLARRRRQQTA
jgi:outer membrane lipase/esterase